MCWKMSKNCFFEGVIKYVVQITELPGEESPWVLNSLPECCFPLQITSQDTPLTGFKECIYFAKLEKKQVG